MMEGAPESLTRFITDFEVTMGPAGSETLFVLMHGWPDSKEMWHSYVKELSKVGHIFTFSQPGFEEDRTLLPADWPRLGIPFVEWVPALRAFILNQQAGIEKKAGHKMKKLVCVSHDAGALLHWGMEAQFPNLFDKNVFLDVGPVTSDQSLRTYWLENLYQSCMGQEVLFGCTPWPCCWLPPLFGHDACSYSNFHACMTERMMEVVPAKSNVRGGQTWFYIQKEGILRAGLCLATCNCCIPCTDYCGITYSAGEAAMGGGRGWAERLHDNVDPKKVLFMFGADKPLHFHQPAFVEKLGPNSAFPFPGNHWFFMPAEDGGTCSPEDFARCVDLIKRHAEA